MSETRVFLWSLDLVTASRLLKAIRLYQRQLRSDGLPPDARLAEVVRLLTGAYGGPQVTSLADVEQVPDVGSVDAPRLLTYDQVAARLQVSERQVKRLVAEQTLPVVRINSAARVHSSDLDDYLDALRQKDTA